MGCGQRLYVTLRYLLGKLVPTRKKGLKSSDKVQPVCLQNSKCLGFSPLCSEFTLGGMQGKLNKFRDSILWKQEFFGTCQDQRVQLWSHCLICDCFFSPRMKCPLVGTNKRFLINTIKNTLPSQKDQDHEQKEVSKEPATSQDQKEESRQKHRTHPYKHSGHARGPARHSPPGKRGSPEKSQKRSSKR